jgi:hypothetical protein
MSITKDAKYRLFQRREHLGNEIFQNYEDEIQELEQKLFLRCWG